MSENGGAPFWWGQFGEKGNQPLPLSWPRTAAPNSYSPELLTSAAPNTLGGKKWQARSKPVHGVYSGEHLEFWGMTMYSQSHVSSGIRQDPRIEPKVQAKRPEPSGSSQWLSGSSPIHTSVRGIPESLRRPTSQIEPGTRKKHGCGSKPMVPFWGR